MKKVILSLILLVAGIVVPMNVWAEGEDCLSELEILEREGKLQRYAEDNILYYDGSYDGVEICSGGGSGGSSSEEGVLECSMDGMTNYDGEEILSAAMMAAVKENYPYYKASADKYGIPWQALAAIHYRERRFSRASNPYQVTGGGAGDFAEQTDEAARVLLSKGSFGSDDAAKSAFFGYNGRSSAYKQQALNLGFSEAEANNGEGSPYVMNKYDEQRDPNKNGSNWGQIKSDGGGLSYPANQDFGAFVVYKALENCQFSSGTAVEPGSYAEAIDQMAKQLAWPNRGNDIDNPKPEYLAALQEYGYTSSSDTQVKRGSSCDVFVAVVLAKSGADTELVSRPLTVVNQRNYLEGSSKWVEVPLNDAQPGDVRTIQRANGGNHIEIVVSSGDSLKIASASNGDRTAEVGSYYVPSGTVKVFRRV